MDSAHPDTVRDIIQQFEGELRKIARMKMARQPRSVLQTTVLLNSACRRIIAANREAPPEFEDEGHFMRLAASAMRSVLTDYARKRRASKRDLGISPVPVSEIAGSSEERELDEEQEERILVIDAIMSELESLSPRMARMAEMRIFGGATIAETAQAHGVGKNAVKLATATFKRIARRRRDDLL